jgi:formylglycine-generating enzyme required for sulfatase activity
MTPAQAKQLQEIYATEHHLPITLTLQLNPAEIIELVLIPPGKFVMGSQDDGLLHQVTIATAFYLGKYAVTQAQWLTVMRTNPAHFKGDDKLPMETISWEACNQFCLKLSSLIDQQARLPSEAEWEYACRAGSSAAYSFGDSEEQLHLHGWYRDNADGRSHPVGSKNPNAWGLYDMHGGIDEYCQDLWHPDYEGAPSNGSAWINNGEMSRRVLRGGSWYDLAEHCGSAHRNYYEATEPSEDHGFRVVIEMFESQAR